VRAYVEHELFKTEGLVKWFSIGPMFRAERPQAGRRRQFHQLGVEAIGATHPLLDAELMALAMTLLQACEITNTRLCLNNVGCRQDRERSSAALRQQLTSHRAELCKDCQARLTRNVFRTLDCKRESCRRLVQRLHVTLTRCAECEQHHQAVLAALRAIGIACEEDATMVRGLDYYTKTVFELRHAVLGAQDALGAGGRYDNLVQDLGGPARGASGFALGLERLLLVRQTLRGKPAAASQEWNRHRHVAVLALDDATQQEAFCVVQQLRHAGIAATMDFAGRSLKAQLRSANKTGAPLAVLFGAQERAQGTVTLKIMTDGTQVEVPRAEVVRAIQARVGPS